MAIYGSNYDYGQSPRYKDEDYGTPVVVDFDYQPDWSYGVSIKYAFNTMIAQSKSYKEQRASIRKYPYREIIVSFFNEHGEATEIINTLVKLLNTEVVLPLYNEGFSCSNVGSLLGVQTINATIEHFFNLQYANKGDCTVSLGGLIIVDKSKILASTLYNIASLSATQVALFEVISLAYQAYKTMFYPAVICYLDSYDETHDTDGLSTMNFHFKEKETWQTHSLT